MANGLFENPKVALGFAGVVVAAGLVASVALSELAPAGQPDPGEDVEEVAEPQRTARSAQLNSETSSGEPGWNEGGLSDDWGSGSVAFAPIPDDPGDSPSEAGDLGFGDYAPETAGASTSRTGSGSRNTQRRGRGSSKVQSRAAPGAPPPRPPGSSDTEPAKVKFIG